MREELAKLLDGDPFLPFHIVMNSGDRYLINNPAVVMFDQNLLQILRVRPDGKIILRLTEIAAVEVDESKVGR
ncbi:MAG: hypothetical protein JO353_08020 [Phycisphaerae bacterium]|nr:hypothetical protein [Phycisphaerae bacterium]